MRLPALVTKTWSDDRRAIIGWAAGIAAFTTIYTGFYPQFKSVAELKQQALSEDVLKVFGVEDMTSATGYLQATVFSLVGPLLLLTAALTLMARTIPRPEEDGGLELLMANPLSRTAFATQRLAAATVSITGLTTMPWLLLIVLAPATGMDISQTNLAAASVGLILLVWCFAGIAFLVGAHTGRRGHVLAVTGTLVVATYLANTLPDLIDGGRWLRWLSPFHYFIGTDPLHTGWHPAHLALLAAIGISTAAAGIVAFGRRDVGV